MREYAPKEIEKKWQGIWEQEEAFQVGVDKSKPKYYALVEFPYPSGQGLHVGHPRPYTAMDIVSRKRRMQGYNVLFPMGWNALGLILQTKNIINGHNGFFFNYLKKGLLIKRKCRLISALPARSGLPMRKW